MVLKLPEVQRGLKAGGIYFYATNRLYGVLFMIMFMPRGDAGHGKPCKSENTFITGFTVHLK